VVRRADVVPMQVLIVEDEWSVAIGVPRALRADRNRVDAAVT
jgi:hypothetical protein